MYYSDAAHPVPTLADKLSHLYTLKGGPSIDLTIRPAYYELLSRLGNPHQSLPPVIHVAGTNGKGSTIAYMKAMLEAQGKKVHTYTSPHLIQFNERIALAGQPIDDPSLESLLDEVIAANGQLPLTFFEITTALAFLAFARYPADIVLLETGVGGRLDCTNVVERPLVSVITPISMDHAEYLGDTLAAIAGEKAGIIKSRTWCVSAPQPDPVISVLRQKTAECQSGFAAFGDTWRIDEKAGQVVFSWRSREVVLNRPPLLGAHQIVNFGTALAALVAVDETILPDPALINRGLANARWPARLQKLDPALLGSGLEGNWQVWIDGGHNGGAGEILAQQAQLWQEEDRKVGISVQPLYLLVGMMTTKDPVEFVRPLAPYADVIMAIPIDGEPLAWEPDALAEHLRGHNLGCEPLPTISKALEKLAKKTPGRVLAAGSLYLAGRILGGQYKNSLT